MYALLFALFFSSFYVLFEGAGFSEEKRALVVCGL